jgi:hypothetical protein
MTAPPSQLSLVDQFSEVWNAPDPEAAVATFADGGTYTDPTVTTHAHHRRVLRRQPRPHRPDTAGLAASRCAGTASPDRQRELASTLRPRTRFWGTSRSGERHD